MTYYFSYGSNMSQAQMRRRCPGARPIGAARLNNWCFLITRRGTANIRRSHAARVYGALWRVEHTHFCTLDQWEGVRVGNFRRIRVLVKMTSGRSVYAETYVSNRHKKGRARLNYMLTAVLPGAVSFALPAEYLDELRSWLPDRAIGDRTRRYVGLRSARPASLRY